MQSNRSAKRANGRPRADPSQGLPRRVYLRHSAFYYVHHDGRWERLGKDLAEAKKLAAALNSDLPLTGTMNAWFDEWTKELDARVKADQLAPRTREDYVDALDFLRPFFGSMRPESIESRHVAQYLDVGRDNDRAVRANRERAALSVCLSWMVRRGHGGLKINVAKGVARNTEKARERYVSDSEFHSVLKACPPSVGVWIELVYRTLQRPADVLSWTFSKNVVADNEGVKTLSFVQSKTRARVSIKLTKVLSKTIDRLVVERKKKGVKSDFLVCREDGKKYTLSGITSMATRAIVDSGVKDFSPYDAKSKGATDMFTSGVQIEQIQHLCAHDSVKTTERYIRQHLQTTVSPNDRSLVAKKTKSAAPK